MVFLVILGIVIIIAIIILGGSYSLFESVFKAGTSDKNNVFSKDYFDEFNQQYKNSMKWLSLQDKKDLIIDSFDKTRLSGSLYQLTPGTKKVMIAVHGYKSDGNRDMARFAKFYRNQGYDFLVIDQRGHGNSQGKYVTFGALESKDLLAWSNKIIELYGEEVSLALHGMSMGGASVLDMTGNQLPAQIKALISDCSYATSKEIVTAMMGKQSKLKALAVETWTRLLIHTDIYGTNPIDSVKNAKVPILFIHGEKDHLIPVEDADKLYEACESRRWIFKIPNADHAYSYINQPLEYEKIVSDFLKEYMKND